MASSCSEMFRREVELDKTQYSLDNTLPHFQDEVYPIPSTSDNPKESLAEFVRKQVVPIKANEISDRLWKAGYSCENIQTLTRYRCLGDNFVVTDHIILHMVWDRQTTTLYIKPLPDWCTSYDIVSAIQNHDPQLRNNIHGFLFTYSRLIQSRYDFKLAKENSLIMEKITWEAWCEFMKDMQFIDCKDMPGRYRYGLLQLDRLNLIKRTSLRHFEPFYFNPHPSYWAYFQHHFQASILLFAFMSILLSSGQVIVSIKSREEHMDDLFYYVSLGCFGVTVEIIIMFILSYVALLFITWVGKLRKR